MLFTYGMGYWEQHRDYFLSAGGGTFSGGGGWGWYIRIFAWKNYAFFQMKVMRNIKAENKQIFIHVWGGSPPP